MEPVHVQTPRSTAERWETYNAAQSRWSGRIPITLHVHTHKSLPTSSVRPTATTRTDFMNKYSAQLQVTSYNVNLNWSLCWNSQRIRFPWKKSSACWCHRESREARMHNISLSQWRMRGSGWWDWRRAFSWWNEIFVDGAARCQTNKDHIGYY